jgi:hypothetical protein
MKTQAMFVYTPLVPAISKNKTGLTRLKCFSAMKSIMKTCSSFYYNRNPPVVVAGEEIEINARTGGD